MKKPNKDILDDPFFARSGLDLSQISFSGKNAGLAWKLEQAVDKMKVSRFILFGMGALIIGFNLFNYYRIDLYGPWPVIISLITGSVYIFGGLFVKRWPISAVLVPSIFFLLNTLDIYWDRPREMFNLFTLLVMGLLGYALYNGILASKVRNQLLTIAREQIESLP